MLLVFCWRDDIQIYVVGLPSRVLFQLIVGRGRKAGTIRSFQPGCRLHSFFARACFCESTLVWPTLHMLFPRGACTHTCHLGMK